MNIPHKGLPFIIAGIVIAIALVVVFAQHPAKKNAPSDGAPPYPSARTASQMYTLADVATHNSAADCWTTINGGVYNVTPWIPQHPGGPQRIISLCGIDGSSAFNGQHNTQPRPNNELATFKIGTLAQ